MNSITQAATGMEPLSRPTDTADQGAGTWAQGLKGRAGRPTDYADQGAGTWASGQRSRCSLGAGTMGGYLQHADGGLGGWVGGWVGRACSLYQLTCGWVGGWGLLTVPTHTHQITHPPKATPPALSPPPARPPLPAKACLPHTLPRLPARLPAPTCKGRVVVREVCGPVQGVHTPEVV